MGLAVFGVVRRNIADAAGRRKKCTPRAMHRWALAASCLLILSGCVRRSEQQVFEVSGSESVEEKIKRVSAIVTDERLARLRQEVKEQLPGLTDAQLAGLTIGWQKIQQLNQPDGASKGWVTVNVTFEYGGGVDPVPIVNAARSIMEGEVNPATETAPTAKPAA